MKKHGRLHLILRFSQQVRGYFLIVLLASFISTILNALIPRIFSFTIDQVLVPGGISYLKEHLWILSLVVIGIALVNGVAIYLYRSNTAKAGETFAKTMRDMLFYHVQRLPVKWHAQNQTGDIIQRCTADVETIRNFVVTQVLEVFRTVFLLVTSLVMMFSMNVKLTFVALAFTPVIVLYSGVFYHLIARNFTAADEAEGELSTVVQENATGVRVVRAFGREKFEIDRFDEKNDIFARLWIRLGTLSGLYWAVGDLITGFQVLFIITLGAVEAVHGGITAGEFIAFASYNTTLVWPVRSLGRILSDMSKAGVSFDRVNYILDSEEEDMSEEGKKPEHMDITFDHVTFGYGDGQNVLKDVSFHIKEGATYGILGGTGSGKSTLVHLLDRLFVLEKGRIQIGGVDIQDIPVGWLREHVGMVMQEPFLFSRTIRENIAAANPEATMEEIREAAKIACVDEEILSFPDGYDTMVGERGVTLSGGQRQRVAIARMLIAKAPIMVFDDSLSAVDAETDTRIRRALKEKMKDATVILISHRITTLMEADRILVLNHGKEEETGTHRELIERDGIYRKIYEIQMNQDDRRLLEEGGEVDERISDRQ
ncbi:ABC transporter ATP-binding protein [Sporofaciens sp. SGI.106]|uniref:ABC transporter ATP-binding protein n=1 Tax=Sporofaciens sp. SGI.106 TaxID=3420568 RepID=UPI003D0443E0